MLASEAALGRDYEELSTMVADMRSQVPPAPPPPDVMVLLLPLCCALATPK